MQHIAISFMSLVQTTTTAILILFLQGQRIICYNHVISMNDTWKFASPHDMWKIVLLLIILHLTQGAIINVAILLRYAQPTQQQTTTGSIIIDIFHTFFLVFNKSSQLFENNSHYYSIYYRHIYERDFFAKGPIK